MPNLTMEAVAKKLAAPEQAAYDPSASPLVEQLYRAYVRLTGRKPDYETLCERAKLNPEKPRSVFDGAIRYGLIDWYIKKYPAPSAENGRKRAGVDRGVGPKTVAGEAEYRFGEPMTASVLENYLIKGRALRNGDARDFILHMAVALHMAPEALDKLLTDCGFHRLHVKNVHHMAIYAVLWELQNGTLPPETDAFAEVNCFFREASALLLAASDRQETDEAADEQEADAFRGGSTRVIHAYICGQAELSRDRVLSFIRNHPKIYGMRHERLLAEHRRLADLFSELYDPHEGKEWTWEGDVTPSAYCFYRFLDEFCQPTDRRHYNDLLYYWIQQKGRHPTRELMICLWIYAFCFLFMPVIDAAIPGKLDAWWCAPDKLPFRGRSDLPFAGYQAEDRKGWFRVLDYLARTNGTGDESDVPVDSAGEAYGATIRGQYAKEDAGPTTHRPFHGDELIAFINDKLNEYSWRSLSKHIPFDAAVMALGELEIDYDRTGDPVCRYGASNMSVPNIWQEDVPDPLVLIVEVLHEKRKLDKDTLPLACKCYELI